MPISRQDLELASFDQLLEEIDRRCSDFVFYGRKFLREKDGSPVYSYRRRQKGSYEATIFLANLAAHELQQDLTESWEEPEVWEEF